MIIEYLLFNLAVLFLSTLGVSLYPGAFRPSIGKGVVAILSVAVPFIIWDELVTGSWWWFNDKFVLGIRIGSLPIEEILFFFVVPWSCLVIWENLKRIIKGSLSISIEICLAIFALLILFYGIFFNHIYLLVVTLLLLGTIAVSLLRLKWFRKKAALVFLCIVLLLTSVFNGYLTSRPVVLYNEEVILGQRINSVPVEDYLYGLVLISLVVMMYEYLLEKNLKSCNYFSASV